MKQVVYTCTYIYVLNMRTCSFKQRSKDIRVTIINDLNNTSAKNFV